MKSTLIREKFIQFFTQKGHQQVAAAPIVNREDPSLLFINAGMNPFKEIFLGNQPIISSRVVSVQPCLRVSGKHNDIEDVGIDTYHHTLFEMLGNWSFGDYTKKEGIQWAWELLTEVYQLPKDRLYVTVFGGDAIDKLEGDQEAFSIWEQYIAKDHILLASKKDNFWEMGAQGPCGPCAEIHIDIRSDEERKRKCGQELVNQDHPQVVEIWNLVFIQYNRLASGTLVELPHQHIDTGMGFERLAMVLQGKQSNYDSDIFTPLLKFVEEISGKKYGQTEAISVAMRVIVDHIRAVTFVIADGQAPSNTKGGYVIRRILRRAIRYGYTYLDLHTPFMHQLVPGLVTQFEKVYPALKAQQDYIQQVIGEEEKAFLKTLALGLHRLKYLNPNHIKGGVLLDGAIAFELYDTHGFPLDLTELIMKEQGISVDVQGFNKALAGQRNRSKKAATTTQSDWEVLLHDVTPVFMGYDQLTTSAKIVQYRIINELKRTIYQVVLDQTPFYPEGGGQVGDTGYWIDNKGKIAVLDTQKENGQIIHYLEKLPSQLDKPIQVVVDKERRMLTMNNHTATHILHGVLKQVLGAHVAQKGSLVNANLLRFDFSHPSKLSKEQVHLIDKLVNQKIRDNITCKEERNVPLGAAKAIGAHALFGEKYGTHVRVITFDPQFSVELCGGTHVQATGQIGLFKIIHETAVGAGLRRIEAVTATAAEQFVATQSTTLTKVKELLKQPKDITKAITKLAEEKRALAKEVATYQAAQIQHQFTTLQKDIIPLDGVSVLITSITLHSKDELKTLATHFKNKYTQLFMVLGATIDQKGYISVVLSEDVVIKWGKDAHTLVKELAKPIQGNGGGQPLIAMAGGTLLAGLPKALALAREFCTGKQASN